MMYKNVIINLNGREFHAVWIDMIGVYAFLEEGRLRTIRPFAPGLTVRDEGFCPSDLAEALRADAKASVCVHVGGYCGGECCRAHCYSA